MPQYKFSVSLRIWHPALSSAEISEEMSLKPDFGHDAGSDRVTQNGRKLGGTYGETLWAIDLCCGERVDAEKILFEDFIAAQNEKLAKHSDFFSKVRDSGGDLEYFVGWFSEGSINMNISLTPELMRATSKLGISIILCAYPENGET